MEDGLNEELVGRLTERANDYIDEGLEEESAVLRALEDLTDQFDENRAAIASRLHELGLEHLPARRQYEAGVRQRLEDAYRPAFDLYDTVLETIAGAAREYWARYQRRTEPDLLIDLLWANLAQAIRVARESGHLLRGGMPLGALALQRTAYELAVRSTVLREYGRHPDYLDLAERYQLHDHVANAQDAEEYQKNATVLKFGPLADEVVVRAVAKRKELINRYGKSFGAQYGWAAGLPGVTAGHFKELEALAGLEHRRGYYRWASHYVHGDAGSLRMSIWRRGGVSNGVLSDLTNVHLTDPAQLSLFALHMTYMAVAFVDPPALADLYLATGIGPLINDAAEAFWTAEQAVEDLEEQLQAELTKEADDDARSSLADLSPLADHVQGASDDSSANGPILES